MSKQKSTEKQETKLSAPTDWNTALQAVETFNPFRSPLRIPKGLQYNKRVSAFSKSNIGRIMLPFALGPVVTILVLIIVELISQFFVKLPNPGAIFITTVVYASFSGGLTSGMVSCLIIILYSMYYFSTGDKFTVYTPEDMQRILTIVVTSPIVAFMVGLLKDRTQHLIYEQQARHNAEATAQMIQRLQAVIDPTLANFEVQSLRRVLLSRIRSLFNVDVAQILIRENNMLVLKAVRGLEESFKTGARIPLGKGFAGKVAAMKRPIMIENVGRTDIKLLNPLLSEKRVKSLLGVPLLIEGKVIGVIHIGSLTQRRFQEGEVQLLQLIADRVALAIDRAFQYQKAQDAIRARDEFLSIASHELKNPLTTMLLQLQDVLRSTKNESIATFSFEKMILRIESVEQQSRRLAKLINDLLNVSFISAGRLELEKEEMDLVSMVKSVIQRFEKQIEQSGSRVSVNSPKELHGMYDRVRIEQVVTNLLSNAIKYGNGKPIEIDIERNENGVSISVKDRGIGIASTQIRKIFNRFERGVSAREYKGLGVGLYISQKIVEAHGGRMRVTSKPGSGSAFIMEFSKNLVG